MFVSFTTLWISASTSFGVHRKKSSRVYTSKARERKPAAARTNARKFTLKFFMA